MREPRARWFMVYASAAALALGVVGAPGSATAAGVAMNWSVPGSTSVGECAPVTLTVTPQGTAGSTAAPPPMLVSVAGPGQLYPNAACSTPLPMIFGGVGAQLPGLTTTLYLKGTAPGSMSLRATMLVTAQAAATVAIRCPLPTVAVAGQCAAAYARARLVTKLGGQDYVRAPSALNGMSDAMMSDGQGDSVIALETLIAPPLSIQWIEVRKAGATVGAWDTRPGNRVGAVRVRTFAGAAQASDGAFVHPASGAPEYMQLYFQDDGTVAANAASLTIVAGLSDGSSLASKVDPSLEIACDDNYNPTGLAPCDVDAVLRQCPSPAQMRQIDADFKVVIDPSIASSPGVTGMPCTQAGAENGLQLARYNVFRMMKKITFDQPMPLIGATNVYDWLKSLHLTYHLYEGTYSQANGTDMWILASAIDAHKRFFTSYLAIPDGYGLRDLGALIMHEARHTVPGGAKPHTCATTVGSDVNPAYGGAWALEQSYMLWLATHTGPGTLDEQERARSLSAAKGGRYSSRYCGP